MPNWWSGAFEFLQNSTLGLRYAHLKMDWRNLPLLPQFWDKFDSYPLWTAIAQPAEVQLTQVLFLQVEDSQLMIWGTGRPTPRIFEWGFKRNRPKSWQWKQKQWKPIKGRSPAKNRSKVPNRVTTLNPYKSGLEWTFEALPVPQIINWESSTCRKRTWVNCTSAGRAMAI